MKKFFGLIGIMLMALILGLVTAQPASAGDGDGIPKGEKVIAKYKIEKFKDKTVVTDITTAAYTARTSGAGAWGELVVTWTGYENKAYMYRRGAAYGERNWTYVSICVPSLGNCPAQNWWQSDGGLYWSYAGPARSGSSAGRCVNAFGQLTTYGETMSVSLTNIACG